MNAKPTPGPWAPIFKEAYYVQAPDLGHVAIMTNLKGAYGLGGRRNGDEVAANARLISTAPDLLEALQEAITCGMVPISSAAEGGAAKHSRQVVVADMIRAAIAKATGETP